MRLPIYEIPFFNVKALEIFMGANSAFDTTFFFLSPPPLLAKAIAMLVLSKNKHILYSYTNSITIMLDLKAIRHFNRIRLDFKNLKY